MLYGMNDGSKAGSARGLEYLQNNAHYKTTNDVGQEVDNIANIVYSDGTAHKAYQAAPDTYIDRLIQKQKSGFPLTKEEQEILAEFWASNPTAGLASLDQLGGNHNGGIRTASGTPAKNTNVNVQQGGNVWAQNVPGEFARLNS